MKLPKKIILVFLFISTSVSLMGQTITVNNSGHSPTSLVNLLLSNSCATSSNISVSSMQSVSYFNNNGSAFPISEGIVIRSGIAGNTQGSYTGIGLDSQVNSNSDADLQAISNQSGQSSTITDAAYLQFDFISSSTNISFDFLFASNEYGEWQCGFSDVFGFLLTDLTTGITTNIAVVPGTQTPVSVRNIRDNAYNSSCNSVNANLFSTYNVTDPANSTLNMRGHTEVLNASAFVTPNNPYRIKLVIGDYNDSNYDSAVFIKTGSFNTTLDLGPDRELCDGDGVLIDSGYTNTTDFSYAWTLNGNSINGETNPTITATQAGIYELTITTISSGCTMSDTVVVNDLSINSPNNLIECDTGATNTFNLTFNDTTVLGLDSQQYEVFYYESIADANAHNSIDQSLVTAYPANGGETIYMRVRNTGTNNFCTTILDFNLALVAVEATIPNNITVCESEVVIDIVGNVESQILNGLNPTDYSVVYYTSETDANDQINAIADASAFSIQNLGNPILIWARLVDNTNPVCFDIVSFNINLLPLPSVDNSTDIYVCSEYTLPTLTNGNYFTGPNGSGTPLNAGDIIDENTLIYIYTVDSQGCANQTSFAVFVAEDYSIDTVYCGEFTVPEYPNAQFYTETGGPNGAGTLIPAGTVLTTSQTIYFYATTNGTDFCTEQQFDIVIHPLPPVDEFDDVVTCDSYTLPTLVNGQAYYTEFPITSSTMSFNSGDVITSSQTLYIVNIDPVTNCSDSSSFTVDIIDTAQFQDLSACGEYTLPNVAFGGYFTGPNGTGNSIAVGTVITSSQTVFYYAPEVTTTPNCTDNLAMNITIHPIPEVDSLLDVLRCENDPYELPALTNGNYFTETGGAGTQLNAGDLINATQRIYVYNATAFCDAETSFNVEI